MASPNLAEVRQQLAELVRRKAEVADSLSSLERQIFMFEGSYLEDPSSSFGNAVRGWDRQMALPSASTESSVGKKRFRQTERIFSNSSATSAHSMGEERPSDDLDKHVASTHMQRVAKASQLAPTEHAHKEKSKKGRKKRRRTRDQ